MSHTFPSESWTAAYKDALNTNPDYAKAGKDWTHGPVTMIVKANSALGIDKDIAMLLDVHGGTCRAATFMDAPAARDAAPFVIEGEYDRWKSVIQGEVEPIKAMMQGKLKLTKGHLPTIIRYVDSSRQLVVSAGRVDSTFLSPST
jgi:putative sterol carrier protein